MMSIEKTLGISRNTRGSTEEHWIPLADIMTGLMMMFLLIALIFMIKVQADTAKIKHVAVLYDQLRVQLYNDLENEFHSDLPKWGATLNKDLTLRFREPDVLFDTGQHELKPRFKAILNDFFPRYVKILRETKYKDSVEEIRIEGHTSSFWKGNTSPEEAYFSNMELSQARTRSALEYVLSIPSVVSERDWLRSRLTANGLSSSKLIFEKNGREDPDASQRVEFKVRTNAEARIAEILQATAQ